MYGPDPKVTEKLFLGLCHQQPDEPFACFFRQKRRTAEKVALRDGAKLSIRCVCCSTRRTATAITRHDPRAPAAMPKKLFVFEDGTEVERMEYFLKHVHVVASIL